VRDGDTGFLSAPGDSGSLAGVLARALGDPDTARAIGERGRTAVHSTLDVDDMARALVAQIER
jgi:glycosyltransferase involved in cell wall biosynthesis